MAKWALKQIATLINENVPNKNARWRTNYVFLNCMVFRVHYVFRENSDSKASVIEKLLKAGVGKKE